MPSHKNLHIKWSLYRGNYQFHPKSRQVASRKSGGCCVRLTLMDGRPGWWDSFVPRPYKYRKNYNVLTQNY
jgi:hypothetical protein